MGQRKRETDYTLYLCTDRALTRETGVEEAVRLAAEGGVGVVQLREKDCTAREFYETALRVKAVTDCFGIPLIINDRVDIALAVDADGVHVGQDDIPAAEARRLLGPGKLVGVSAHNVRQARQAVSDGADYLGVGAMFATGTKHEAQVTAKDELERIREAVDIPIVAIGGINADNLSYLEGTGIDGIAVVSAILAAPDIRVAAAELAETVKELKRK